jgi:predicted negative regulator of RcsB-dependent stress response
MNTKIVAWVGGGIATVLAGLFGWRVWNNRVFQKEMAAAYDRGGQKAVAKVIRDWEVAEGTEATYLAKRYSDQVIMGKRARRKIDRAA